jgi:hypothetical protein
MGYHPDLPFRRSTLKRYLFIFSILVVLAAGATARAAEGLPPGKWWERPDVVQKIGLTAQQREQLDKIFHTSAAELIDLRGEVQKRSIDLRAQLDQQQLSKPSIQVVATRLSEARGRLFQRELMMFVDMRSVLSVDQWNRFRDELATREGPGNDRGPGQRPRRQRP